MKKNDVRIGVSVWGVNVFSSTGNIFVYLYCAYIVGRETGSIFLGSLVFSLQWILPVFAGPLAHALNTRYRPRTVLLASTLLGLAILPALLFVEILIVPFVVAGLLGGLESIVKITRLIALKSFAPPEKLGSLVSVTATGQFAGSALGGIVFALLPPDAHFTIVATAALFQMLCLGAALLIPHEKSHKIEAEQSPSLRAFGSNFVSLAKAQPELMRALIGLIAVCGLLQGYHNVVRVTLPLEVWKASTGDIGILQFAIAAAVILGALVYARFPAFFSRSGIVVIMAVTSVAAMIFASAAQTFPIGLAFYSLFFFWFEVLFMAYQSAVMKHSTDATVSLVVSVQYMLINAVGALLILAGGFLAEAVGFVATAVIYGGAFLGVVGFTFRKNMLAHLAQQPDSLDMLVTVDNDRRNPIRAHGEDPGGLPPHR